MVRGILKYEDAVFDMEGDFGMIMITTADDNGVNLETASFGKGDAVKTAYALGQGIANTLNALAGKNLAKRAIVWDAFFSGMVRHKE